MARPLMARVAAGLLLASLTGCEAKLPDRVSQSSPTLGAALFRELCQRFSYAEDLDRHRADPQVPLDVSGTSRRALCAGEASAAPDDPRALRTLIERRTEIIEALDAAVPEPLLPELREYLSSLRPLQDDGTTLTLSRNAGRLTASWAASRPLTEAIAELNGAPGMSPRELQGEALRAALAFEQLGSLIEGLAPLASGGAASPQLQALLASLEVELQGRAAEVGALEPIGRLLLSSSAALRGGEPLDWARRAEVGPNPTPPPFSTGDDAVLRDARGRALGANGQPLYPYADLDGSLLMALLREGQAFLGEGPPPPDLERLSRALGQVAEKLAGSRSERTLQRGTRSITFQGFDGRESPLLDAVHAADAFARITWPGGTPGLRRLVSSLKAIVAAPGVEAPLARALSALEPLLDEAAAPRYRDFSLAEGSPVLDELGELAARIFAIPGLADDLVTALRDPHTRGLWPMLAQLMDERGAFFMKQPDTLEERTDGLDPKAPGAVIGTFGHKPDRNAADADVELVWRGTPVTVDPRNNRSVMQRLLHLLADTNGGRPLCNGRNASMAGHVFPARCDMFRVDNTARLFLLSIASRPLREDTATFARQSASFLSAFENGAACRGTSADPAAAAKCEELRFFIEDGLSGDSVLEGLMGIRGFGRFPSPEAAGRLLFLDLGDAGSIPPFARPQPKRFMFNRIEVAPGQFEFDPADPDARKFVDSTGKERLFIEEHNGVMFALEAVRAPQRLPDGTSHPFPDDNFYDAFRPLVDAFARHAECLERDASGKCLRGHNAVQILADAMGWMHRHWPTAQSSVRGRSFAQSYGSATRPDGLSRLEPLLASALTSELMPAQAELLSLVQGLTAQDTGARVLPELLRALRFLFDPTQAPPGLAFRNGDTVARWPDGTLAHADPLLAEALGAPVLGRPSLYSLLLRGGRGCLEALASSNGDEVSELLAWGKERLLDSVARVETEDTPAGRRYRLADRRVLPMSILLLSFLEEELGDDLGLVAGTTGLLQSPVFSATVDLGTRLPKLTAAPAAYALVREALGNARGRSREAIAVGLAELIDRLSQRDELALVAEHLGEALSPTTGLATTGLELLLRSQQLELASWRQDPAAPLLPIRLARNLYQRDARGSYPLQRLTRAFTEVNRRTTEGPLTAGDLEALLRVLSELLQDEARGLPRFLEIVRQREAR